MSNEPDKSSASSTMKLLKYAFFSLIFFLPWTVMANTQTLSNSGWHLVHPGAMTSTELDALFNTQTGLESIWSWNATGESWEVRFKSAPATNPFTALTSLQADQGYWFRISSSVSLEGQSTSTINTFADYGLGSSTRWHLLGANTTMDVLSFFSSNFPTDGTVWKWENSQWSVYTNGDTGSTNQFNTQYGTQFSNLRSIESGQGFWVNMASGISIPLEPSNVRVHPGAEQALISWDATSGVNEYTLAYGINPGIDLSNSQSYLGKITSTDTSEILTGLNQSETYYFVVVNGTGQSYAEVYPLVLNNSTGNLTIVSQLAETAGVVEGLLYVNSVTLSPDEKFLYSTASSTSGHDVVVAQIDSSTGTLGYVETESNDSQGERNMSGPRHISISPDGLHAYVSAYSSGAIVIFDRDGTTGALTYKSNLSEGDVGTGALLVQQKTLLSSDGKFLYAIGHNDASTGTQRETLSVFSRSSSTGLLTHVQTFVDESGLAPTSLILSPDEKFLYTNGTDNGNLLLYARHSETGLLTYVTQYSKDDNNLSHLADLKSFKISPDGAFMYVVSGTAGNNVVTDAPGNAIVVFSRNTSDGTLTFLEEHTAATIPSLERGLDLAISADGMSVYSLARVSTSISDDSINLFRRNLTDGKLTLHEVLSNSSFADNYIRWPNSMVLGTNPSGAYVAALNRDSIVFFSRDSTAESAATALTIPATPLALSASASNAEVTLSWNASTGTVSYTLYRSSTAGIDINNSSSYEQKYENLTETSTVVSSLSNDTQYFFVLTANNHKGESLASAEVNATPTSTPIVALCESSVPLIKPAVADLLHFDLSTETDSGRLRLNWIPIRDANSYEFDAFFASGSFSNVASNYFNHYMNYRESAAGLVYLYGTETMNWYFKNFDSSTEWTFAVDAKSGNTVLANTTGHTGTAGVSTNTLSQPRYIWGTSGEQSISVQWCGVTGNEGYQVHYGTSPSAIESNTISVGQNVTMTTLSGMAAGTTYYVTVRAIASGKKGIPAYPVAFTPATSSSVDFSIDSVTLNQSVQANVTTGTDSAVPMIADKPTLLRVFTKVTGATQVDKIQVKLTGTRNGVSLDPVLREMALSDAQKSSNDEEHTPLTFEVPSAWLQPGTSFVVELDVDGEVSESDENNNRFPSSGSRDFGFVTAPTAKVRLVSMQNTEYPALTITDSLKTSLSDYLKALYPLANLTLDQHATVLTFPDKENVTDSTTSLALTALETFRDLDASSTESDVFYYGVINGNVGGLGYINAPNTNWALASVGSVDLGTFAHELGHNHGRFHVENSDETNDEGCQNPSNVDNNYPYNSTGAEYGRIGKVGYNHTEQALYSKTLYHDLMSYCGRSWVSDYTYSALHDFQNTLAAQTANFARTVAQEGVLIYGTFANEEWSVDQIYFTQQGISSSGRYELTLEDATGRKISTSFNLQIRDHSDLKRFRVFIPTTAAIQSIQIVDTENSETLLVQTNNASSGSLQRSGSTTLTKLDESLWQVEATHQAQRVIRLSTDEGTTWRVLLMDQDQTAVSIEANVGNLLEIQRQEGLSISKEQHRLE